MLFACSLLSGCADIIDQAENEKDINGWRKAKWGMTERQIVNVFSGEAIQLPAKEEHKEGSYANLGINNYDIDGDKYKVRFLMDKNTQKLKEVIIMPMMKNPYDFYYKRLQEMLIDKYGSPDYNREETDPDRVATKTDYKTVWNFPSTKIELTYIQVETNVGGFSFVFLSYVEKDKSELNKL